MRTRLTSRMKKWVSVGLAAALIIQLALGIAGDRVAEAADASTPNHLIIHQVYGGGGKGETPFTHSFIELYNPTNDTIDLSGWTVDYSSSRGGTHAGSTEGGAWASLNLSGEVAPYASFLILGAAETEVVQIYAIDQFDQEWTGRYIDNDQYNVRLLNDGTTVDQVTVNEAIKDASAGTVVPSVSKQKSIRRVDFASTYEVLEFKGAGSEFVAANRPRSLIDGAWGLAPIGGEPGEGDTVIKVFHTNDIHGRAGYDAAGNNGAGLIGFAQFKSFIDAESADADGKLVLDAGDVFHGQPFASLNQGESIAKLIQEVGYDAISPGNHDFNYGVDRLLDLETLSGTPLLSANIMEVDAEGNKTPLIADNTMIKEIDGIKVGIFGLTTPETAYKTNPKNVETIDFGSKAEVIEAAETAVEELQQDGAQIIIALAHLGLDATSEVKSSDIANALPSIDLIIDGHSHHNLTNGQIVNGVTIASAGEYFKNAGVVTIGYDKEESVVTAVAARTYSAPELTLTEYPENTAIKAQYDNIALEQEVIQSEIVGSTPILLDGVRDNVRGGETNLGRVITNAMLAESGADIAITNGGGIRASINAGDITKGSVITTLPFGNYIVTKSLTGAQIKSALEQGMAFGAGSFPHYAGMEVTVNKQSVASGSTTIEKGRVVSITVDGDPMDMAGEYVVATNDFMAAGGDGYTALQAPDVLNNFAALDEAVINYLDGLTAGQFQAIDAEQRLYVEEKTGGLSHLGSYSTGHESEDGGVAEIVKYNPDNRKMYVVNGMVQQIDIVSLADLKNGGGNAPQLEKRVDVSEMIPGFEFGDITSIDVNTELKLIAAAVQEADYQKEGAVLLLDYDGNLVKHIAVGVQPDMVTFTPDGNYILTADEGEPREGYGTGVVDPKGSVSVIDLTGGIDQATAHIVTFDAFDSQRDALVADQVILKKETMPSVDLEPEYVAVSADSKTAYVSLQEANSIATLDIENGEFVSVIGLGFKDHSLPGNELDLFRDSTIQIQNENVYGVYMPDGLAVADIGGKRYLFTPNEGDAREWGDGDNEYANIDDATINGKKFDALINSEHDGLEDGATYILGGRSFTIWDADTMELVFDSGSDFEKMTAELYPDRFNVSNDNLTKDHRSSKKGPEPEDVKVAEIDGKFYAAIGLERIGGVMMYDVTDPSNAVFYDYINTRDYSDKVQGDVSPEGLAFVKAEHSPTGYPLLLAAHEVSGTVAVYQIHEGFVEPQPIKPFKLTVEKSTASGMTTYRYALGKTEAAATYTDAYYVVVQLYEGANAATPGMVLIKKVAAGTLPSNEEIRVGQGKQVKIMVVSSPDGSDAKVLADAYGAE